MSSLGGIFLCYRRESEPHLAGRLYDRLQRAFGEENVFIDVKGIPPGANYTEAIKQKIASCNVLIALIGPDWTAARDRNDRRRLDNPDDFVALEIGTALALDRVVVIPLLYNAAAFPAEEDLPEALKPLNRL